MLNETVKEWIAKAEGDFAVACREMRAGNRPTTTRSAFIANSALRS